MLVRVKDSSGKTYDINTDYIRYIRHNHRDSYMVRIGGDKEILLDKEAYEMLWNRINMIPLREDEK